MATKKPIVLSESGASQPIQGADDIDSDALDSDLTALANQSGTNTFPVRTASGTISEQPFSNQTDYTATVTLVGGSGNTVPVYSTNTAYYSKIGKTCFVWINNTGDGGAEGAGTGVYTVALPFQAASTSSAGEVASGSFKNGSNTGSAFIAIAASATTATVSYTNGVGNVVSLTGADQNNATRRVTLAFAYTTTS